MRKKIRCPVCNSKMVNIIEVFSVSSTYHYPDYQEVPCAMPDFLHTMGECHNCKHLWKFRKYIDIDTLSRKKESE